MYNENAKTYSGSIKAVGSLKGKVAMGTVVKIPGLDGATYTPHIDEFGNLSWTNDMGLPNPDPVNITGPQGIPGENGIPGEPGRDGKDGKDYVLTEADKDEIATMAYNHMKAPTEEYIKDFINTALGVIENGSY